jgi:hypothetical protein
VGGYWSGANLCVHAPQVLCGWDIGVCRSVRHPFGQLLERISMEDLVYELPRIHLLGTRANRGKKKAGPPFLGGG